MNRINLYPGRRTDTAMAMKSLLRLSDDQATTHDFVNSLSSVRSLVELLVAYPGLDAGDRSRFIGILRDETERLVQLMAHMKVAPDVRTG